MAVDPIVLAFTSAVTFATAALFGLGPALQIARQSSLAQTPATLRSTSSRSVRRWHHAIVVAELAMAQVLLVGAGLLLASFVASQRVPLGYATQGRVAADLSLAPETYLRPVAAGGFSIDTSRKVAFVNAVLERLRQAPGVRAAAAGFTSPLTGAPNRGISIEGRPAKGPGLEDTADFQVITPDYFRALGATLVRGRDIGNADRADTTRVAVVNQAFVDRYFPGEEPIGRRFRFGGAQIHEIVGIAADMRYRKVESAADPTFYIPITQNTERWPFMSFTIWSDGDTTSAAATLREAIRAADPNLAVTRIRSFDDSVATALAPRRFNTTLVVAFAVRGAVARGCRDLRRDGVRGVHAHAGARRAGRPRRPARRFASSRGRPGRSADRRRCLDRHRRGSGRDASHERDALRRHGHRSADVRRGRRTSGHRGARSHLAAGPTCDSAQPSQRASARVRLLSRLARQSTGISTIAAGGLLGLTWISFAFRGRDA